MLFKCQLLSKNNENTPNLKTYPNTMQVSAVPLPLLAHLCTSARRSLSPQKRVQLTDPTHYTTPSSGVSLTLHQTPSPTFSLDCAVTSRTSFPGLGPKVTSPFSSASKEKKDPRGFATQSIRKLQKTKLFTLIMTNNDRDSKADSRELPTQRRTQSSVSPHVSNVSPRVRGLVPKAEVNQDAGRWGY